MHVFFVIDSLASSGGAEQALAASTPELISRGISCTIQPIQDRQDLTCRLLDAGATVLPPIPGSRRSQLRSLTTRIHAVQPDLVHTTLFESDTLGRPAARLAGARVVSSLVNVAYGADQAQNLPPLKLAAARILDTATARLAVRFHALTNHVRDQMGTRLHIAANKIDVIPRGRDPKLLGSRSATRRQRARESFGIRPAQTLIVSAARHEYQKGLDLAIKALVEVTAQRDDVAYLIAGRAGNETAVLRSLIDTLGLSSQIRLLGARNDVPELLSAADLVVVPSRWEGLGSTLIEAMALEAPLVVADTPAVRETVGGPSEALLVAPNRVDALAAGILDALGDENGRLNRVVNARRRFQNRYTLGTVVDETIQFYERAMRQTTRRPANRMT